MDELVFGVLLAQVIGVCFMFSLCKNDQPTRTKEEIIKDINN